MSKKKRQPLPINWDSLSRFHQINNLLLPAASGIDDLGVDCAAWAIISEKLMARHGINLRQLRDVCDEMTKIEAEEYKRAADWDKKYLEQDSPPMPKHNLPKSGD